MVLFNYSTKEITAKIVYYGPGLCGKTTNLQFIYDNLPGTINKGKMLSLATKTDRTLFFDFLPIDLGTIRGMRTRLQLYTVPGQVFYNTTRKLVLKGADGVVFVADSQKRMIEANLESFRNLEENLAEHDMKIAEMPLIIQFNKRDLPDLLSLDELNAALNKYNAPIYEGVATTGIGVHETLKAITRLVLNSLKERYADKREQRQDTPERAAKLAAASARAAVLQSQPQSGALGPIAAPKTPLVPIGFPGQVAPVATTAGIVTEKVDSRPSPKAAAPTPPLFDLEEALSASKPADAFLQPPPKAAAPMPPLFDLEEPLSASEPADAFLQPPPRASAPTPPLFDLEEPLSASEPADALFTADDEPILEIIPDADETPSGETEEVFELADDEPEEASQALFADLEPVEDPLATSAESPLDLTEQVLPIDQPDEAASGAGRDGAIGEFSLEEELSLDLDAGVDLAATEDESGETAFTIDLREDLGIAEPADTFPASEKAAPPEPATIEGSPLDLEGGGADEAPDLESVLARTPEAPVEVPSEPEVTHVSAAPLGRQRIDVPVQLQIGDHSIRFHLTISLDIPQLVRPGGNGDGTGSTRR